MYKFDTLIERRGTGSVKWDGHAQLGFPADALPLWVADMDFPVPAEITEAIKKRIAHEVYGYTLATDSYYDSIRGWMERRYSWPVAREWILTVPGVVPAINLALHAFTKPGDAVLIQPPVYPPFSNAVLGNDRRLIKNPLVLVGDRYCLDLEDFEAKVVENRVRLFVLCSPHNPVGRVWSPEELSAMAEICLRRHVLIVADEIHQDLAFPGVRHYPLPALVPACNENTIICTAPSKSFNIAGLQTSNIIVPDPLLREKYAAAARCWGMSKVNALGLVACEAAYTYGAPWLDAAMAYVAANGNFVREYLGANLPQLKVTESQGLFLLWLDLRGLGFTAEELETFLLHRARLWLNQGYTFGEEGRGFVRLNIACPRARLEQALGQLEAAVNQL
jgi:cystathionine beta-lyase